MYVGSGNLIGNWLGSKFNIGYCDSPLLLSPTSLLLWLLTLLPLATALLPRPTGVGGVSLRLTSMGPGVGEWEGLICPLVFKFVITSSRSSLLLALLVLDEEDCRLKQE